MGKNPSRGRRSWRKRWRKNVQIVAAKITTTFYRRVVVLVRALDDTLPNHRSRLPVEVALLTEHDLTAYRELRPDQSVPLIRSRLARGDRCFVTWYEGRIVDAGWVATGRVPVPYLGRNLFLDAGDIYHYDAFTLPAYRSRGIYMARNAYTAQQNRQGGYSRCIALVAVENKAPLAILRKAGLTPIGQYSCLRLGPWHWCWQRAWGEEALPILSRKAIRGERCPDAARHSNAPGLSQGSHVGPHV